MYAVILTIALIFIELNHFIFFCLLAIKHLLTLILHDVHLPILHWATTSCSFAPWVAWNAVIQFWSFKCSVFKSEFIVIVLKLCCLMTVRVCMMRLVLLQECFILELERSFLWVETFIWLSVDDSLIIELIWLFFLVFVLSGVVLLYVQIGRYRLLSMSDTSTIVFSTGLRCTSAAWVFVIDVDTLALCICLFNLFHELPVPKSLALDLLSRMSLVSCCAESQFWLGGTGNDISHVTEWPWSKLRLNGFIMRILTMRFFMVCWRAILWQIILKLLVVDAFIHHDDVLLIKHRNMAHLAARQFFKGLILISQLLLLAKCSISHAILSFLLVVVLI